MSGSSLRDADTAQVRRTRAADAAGYTYFTVPGQDPVPSKPSPGPPPITLPTEGYWNVTVVAVDTADQYDFSNTGATAHYLVYPTDTPPDFNPNLLAPNRRAPFNDGKIFVSGRAEDDQAMAKVEVQVQNAANQFMTSSGSFSSSQTWITAFLTSPGTPGSNFSYTTPIVPPGPTPCASAGTDQHDLVTTTPPPALRDRDPTGEHQPVAVIDPPVCTDNVCQFDGRHSTDENAATLTYSWNFGTGAGTGTGPNPKKTYTLRGTYTVTLTVKDQWGLLSDPVSIHAADDHRAAGQRRTDPGVQRPVVHRTDLQLLGSRHGRPEHGRHHHLRLGLRRLPVPDEHAHRFRHLTRVHRQRHLHRHAHRHGRLGQVDLRREGGHRHRPLGVMPSQVVQPGDGCGLPDCRVGPVVVVLVDPCWQSGEPG